MDRLLRVKEKKNFGLEVTPQTIYTWIGKSSTTLTPLHKAKAIIVLFPEYTPLKLVIIGTS